MPLIFTRDQIRRYLSEMGFDGLTESSLNLFIHDLKKLIKHEDKKRKARLRTAEGEPDITSPSGHIVTVRAVESLSITDFSLSSEQNSIPSPPKSTPRISINPGKSPEASDPPAAPAPLSSSSPKVITDLISSSTSTSTSSSSPPSVTPVDCVDETTENCGGRRRIVKSAAKYPCKTDPVTLYHFYKSIWDRQKAPGEDRHMQLRWNIRTETMGNAPCDPVIRRTCKVPPKCPNPKPKPMAKEDAKNPTM